MKRQRFTITEKQRTVILILLLAISIGFYFWTKNQYNVNFTDNF